jgi:hypothetical protein
MDLNRRIEIPVCQIDDFNCGFGDEHRLSPPTPGLLRSAVRYQHYLCANGCCQVVMETARFTKALPVRKDFRTVLDDAAYQPAPADWLIAVSDVVGSRKAIDNGQYKAVNMAGVAMISALMNALDTRDLPFVFGGDGAAVICAPSDRALAADVMAKTVAWVLDELGLVLRAALVPVSAVRQDGFDVQVQAMRVSQAVNNYAFRGGGISHAEALMKSGKHAIEPAPAASRPDLTGLSCRWTPIKADGQNIVSIIIEAGENAVETFPQKASEFLQLAGMGEHRSGSPMPEKGPGTAWPPAGLDLKARASRQNASLALYKARLYFTTLFAWVLFKTGIALAGFDPNRYREFTSLNTDYRKFQDGLRITVSLGEADLKKLTDFLEHEREAKHLRYGLCVQDSAVLTCYVPSVTSDTHFHFLDGAGGGYAQAATNMKA